MKWRVTKARLGLAGALIVTLAVAGAAMVSALVSDSGTVDVQVPDKTTSKVNQMTAQGAFVSYFGDSDTTFGAAGTGLFDPFLRLQASPTERGYNTCSQASCGGNVTEFDTKTGTWTHAIKVSEIPQRPCPDLAGTPPPPPPPALNSETCFELFVDINDSNTAKYISLNTVQVFYTDNPRLTNYATFSTSPPAGTTKQYEFNGDILIHDVNQGSGRGDLRYDIPIGNGSNQVPLPPGCFYGSTTCNTYFVLYSKWGTTSAAAPDGKTYASEGGFEEWKVKKYPVKSGMKFEDLDANGVRDTGEPGISGVTIKAYADTNGDGILDAGEITTPPATSGTTDSTGTYSLTFPSAGKYVVCEVLPTGFVQSAPSNTICSAGAPTLGAGGYAEDLDTDSRVTGNDFGNYSKAELKGIKVIDYDADGNLESGDICDPSDTVNHAGCAGVTINLTGTDGKGNAVSKSTTTGDNGAFSFKDLVPGSYTVCEVVPAGFFASTPTCSGPHTLISDQVLDLSKVFGNYSQGEVHGLKFSDDNENGVRDPGEVGLGEWTINLTGTDSKGNTVSLSTTTDSDGNYAFLNLNPGDYTVCEVLQSGWNQTKPSSGPTCPGPTFGYSVTLTSDQVVNDLDFGNWRPKEGCTPGFWGGPAGKVLWDGKDDAIVMTLVAAFDALDMSLGDAEAVLKVDGSNNNPHGASWYAVFAVPSLTPLRDHPGDNLPFPLTLYETTPQGGMAQGEGAGKLARFATASLLNAAAREAGLMPGFAFDVATVLDMVQEAWAAHLSGDDATMSAIADELAAASSLSCPLP